MPYPYYPPAMYPFAPYPYPDPESFERRIQLPPIYKWSNNYLPAIPAIGYEIIPAHWETYRFEEDPNPEPDDDDEKAKNLDQKSSPTIATAVAQTNGSKDPKTQGVFRPNKQYEINGNINANSQPQAQFYEHQEPDTTMMMMMMPPYMIGHENQPQQTAPAPAKFTPPVLPLQNSFQANQLQASNMYATRQFRPDAGPVNSKDKNTCSICLEPIKSKDPVRILYCTHKFHLHCIDEWLLEQQTCPVCRVRIDYV